MSRTGSSLAHRCHAFTLVELLVVIGIIALLISILLPSLNRARQQAYLVDCQSRMRQMGQAIHLYVSANKGHLPAAEFTHTSGGVTHYPLDTVPVTKWRQYSMPSTLSRVLGHPDPWRDDHNPIFQDVDITKRGYDFQKYMNNYAFNFRLFPGLGAVIKGKTWNHTVPITSIPNSSEVVAAWDAEQWGNYWWGGNAYHVADGLMDQSGNWILYSTSNNQSGLSYINYETPMAYTDRTSSALRQGTIHHRHMNRTTANVLFLDGHCESKKGNPKNNTSELKIKDFCVPPKW